MSFQIGNAALGVTFTGDLGSLQRTLDQAGGSVDQFGRRSTGALRGVTGEADRAYYAMGRLANGIKGAFVGGSVAVGLITLKNSVMATTTALIDAQVQIDRWRNGFAFGAGGMAQGAQEFAFLREEVNRLGLNLGSTASQYMKMVAASRGSSLAGAQTREVFKSIAEASVVMGMNADQNERAFMAVTQMMSKGKVMAEELRGQLGEHLPGAFSIAARAMGVTEVELNKLMETGQVFSADFLPKFAAQLRKELTGSVEQSSLSMQANLNRLATAWLNFKQQVAQAGAGAAISSGIKTFSGDLQVLGEVLEASRKQGDGFWMSVNNAAGVGIARGTMGLLAMPFNAFNATVNALTGNVLGLNENLSFIPVSARSAAEQVALLDGRMNEAQKRLERLQALDAQPMNGDYFKGAIAETVAYISTLRLAQSEKLKLMGRSDVGSMGSVGSGDTALARADRAKYEQELAARAALRKKYATPAEKLAEELASQRAMLGGLWSPEEEKRIRDSMGGRGGGGGRSRSAAQAKDEFADVLGRLTAKDVGIDPSFYEDLNTLHKGYTQGRIAIDGYRNAVELLINTQAFAKKATEDEAEANKTATRALEDSISAAERAAGVARKNAQTQWDELQTLGMSALALHELEQARLADAAASLRRRAVVMDDIDLSGRAGDAMREEAAELLRLAEIKRETYAPSAVLSSDDTIAEAVRINGRVSEDLSDSLANSISQGILEGARSGSSIMEIFRRELQAQFARTILRPMVQPVAEGMNSLITSGLNAFLGAFGMGATSSGYNPGAGGADAFGTNWEQYLPSYAGGGHTGNGARSGGLDGQGGFMAMLHPRERVVDEAAGGGNVILNVITPPGQAMTATQSSRTGEDGTRIVDLILTVVGDGLANRSGPVARGLESGYGDRLGMA
jgi:tape measure domain-containing protein